MSQNNRNHGFSYFFCLMMEGSGSGSWRPQNIRILRIRIHNTLFAVLFFGGLRFRIRHLVLKVLRENEKFCSYASQFVSWLGPIRTSLKLFRNSDFLRSTSALHYIFAPHSLKMWAWWKIIKNKISLVVSWIYTRNQEFINFESHQRRVQKSYLLCSVNL